MNITSLYLSGEKGVSDNLLPLLKEQYKSVAVFYPVGEEQACLKPSEAKQMLADGEEFKFYKTLIKGFKDLQKSHDFVLCEGINSEKLDLDLDKKIAKNLGIVYAKVLKDNEDILNDVKLEINQVKSSGCTYFATFVPNSSKDFSNIKEKVFTNFKDSLELLKNDFQTPLTPCMFEYELFARAKQKNAHIVLPESGDDRILQATSQLLSEEIAKITLLGDEGAIKKRAGELKINLDKANFLNPENSELCEEFANTFYELRKAKGISLDDAKKTIKDPNYFATMMVYLGQADGMVSGAVGTTADTIRPALQIIKTKPGVSIVSSIFLMCLDTEVFAFGDCAVNPEPNSEHLAQIALTSAKTASLFGLDPKVAMLSYSTGSSGKGEAVEKVKEALKLVKEADSELKVDGPLQFDAAIDKTVAKKKMPESKVAGEANTFIFPDLNAGNIGYKAVQRTANAIAIGPILQGLKKPVNDLSRGCLVKDIVNTIAITALQGE